MKSRKEMKVTGPCTIGNMKDFRSHNRWDGEFVDIHEMTEIKCWASYIDLRRLLLGITNNINSSSEFLQ